MTDRIEEIVTEWGYGDRDDLSGLIERLKVVPMGRPAEGYVTPEEHNAGAPVCFEEMGHRDRRCLLREGHDGPHMTPAGISASDVLVELDGNRLKPPDRVRDLKVIMRFAEQQHDLGKLCEFLPSPDLTIRHAQKHQPWTVPYSDGVMVAEGSKVPHILGTHTTLHAMKTVGKLAAVFESMDHPAGANAIEPGAPTTRQREAIRDAAADLMTASLRLANLYEFDLQDALCERVEEKNGRGFDPPQPKEMRCKAEDSATGLQCAHPDGHEGAHEVDDDKLGLIVWNDES